MAEGGQAGGSESREFHPNQFLKSHINMPLECGRTHFCSLRSNRNTKAFCVVSHGIRHEPPDPAQRLTLKSKRAEFPAGHQVFSF